MQGSWELDACIGTVLFLGLIRGAVTGPTAQFVNLSGVGLAFLLAFWLMEPVGNAIAVGTAAQASEMLPVGYGVSFVTGFFVLYALYHLVREHDPDARKLYVIERVLGGGAGVLCAMAFVSVLLLALDQENLPDYASRAESVLYAPVADIVHMVWALIPEVLGVGTLADQFAPSARHAMVDALLGLEFTTPFGWLRVGARPGHAVDPKDVVPRSSHALIFSRTSDAPPRHGSGQTAASKLPQLRYRGANARFQSVPGGLPLGEERAGQIGPAGCHDVGALG